MNTFKLGLAAITLFAAVTFNSCKEEVKTEEVEVEVVEGITGEFNLDPASSSFSWLGTKVTGEHTGTIDLYDGVFTASNGELVGGKAVIDMATITVTDIEDAEMNAKLLGHLTTEDFFATETYPYATLEVTGVEGSKATGSLTIKDITHPVEFEYVLSEMDDMVMLEGTLVVDRTLYDIKYGSGKFFEDLGDKTISDEFELSFKAVAKK